MDAFITIPYNCIWNLSEKGKMAIFIHSVPSEMLKSSRNANQAHFYTTGTQHWLEAFIGKMCLTSASGGSDGKQPSIYHNKVLPWMQRHP